MASTSFDREKSWPTIVVNRAASASMNGAALAGRTASRCSALDPRDLGRDRIDRLQAFDHLARERRLSRLEHLDELTSGMSRTKGELDLAARRRIDGFIAEVYNKDRLHSALGYQSPLSLKPPSRKTRHDNASWQPRCHRNYLSHLRGAVQNT